MKNWLGRPLSTHGSPATKILLFMKMFSILMLAACLQVSAKGYSQKLSLSEKNASLGKVIKEIRKKTGYQFFYRDELLLNAKPVDIHVKDASLREVLDLCFRDQPLDYLMENNTIILVARRTPLPVPASVKDTTRTITGRIASEKGGPVPGATVTVVGAGIAIAASDQGEFTLKVPLNARELIISSVGYASTRVVLGRSDKVMVVLKENITADNDVVVVAYGTQKRKDMIGSVSKITGKDISNSAYSDYTQALQGLASGVQVSTQGDGVPGAKAQIRIRGVNSISNSSEPLYVIDGVPGAGGSWSLNPGDIESVTVLKDAIATAIYGSRASNGVILVTTKAGKAGNGLFQADLRTGISSFADKGFHFANTETQLAAMDLAVQNDSKDPNARYNPNDGFSWNAKMPTLTTRTAAEQTHTNMADAVARTGSFREANLSLSKGSDKTTMFFSLNYRNDKGVMIGSSQDRIIARANLNFTPVKNLDLGFRTGNSFSSGKTGAGFYNANVMWLPWMPVYDTASATGYWNVAANPLAMADHNLRDNNTNSFNSFGTFTAGYNIPFVEGLSLKANVGYNYSQSKYLFWSDKNMLERNTQATSVADESNSNGFTALANFGANYTRTIGDHSFNAVFGYEMQKGWNDYMSISGKDLNGTHHLVGTPGTIVSANTSSAQSGLAAWFGRLSYKFMNRYLLEGSLRRDGSSAFSPEKRWGTFTAIGGGWILSDEPFFPFSDWLSLFKIRGSVGQTGNGDIPPYKYLNNYAINSGGGTYMNQQSSYILSVGNPAISWETSNNKDLGFDFGLLGGRINGSFAWYQKDVSGLLLQVPLPYSAGITGGNSIWQNIGDMSNRGYELNISATIIRTADFTWEASFNHTINTNRVNKLHPQVDLTGSGIITDRTITKKGLKLATYYLPEYAGVDPDKGIPLIWEVDKDVYAKTGQTARTGKKIPLTSTNGANNRMILEGRSGIPDWYGGFSNSFRYKDFDLSMVFTYQGGLYFYDESLRLIREGADKGDYNVLDDLLSGSWKQPGDHAKYPQLQFNGGFYYDDAGNPTAAKSGRFNGFDSRDLQKGNYLKLKNLAFGYNLPVRNPKAGVTGIRIYADVTNVLTFTSARGLDPEYQLGNNVDGLIGGYNMPTTRTYTLGVSVKF